MQQFTFTELWGHMGLFARLVVYVLLLMSLSSIVVMAERLVSFVRSSRGGLTWPETISVGRRKKYWSCEFPAAQ